MRGLFSVRGYWQTFRPRQPYDLEQEIREELRFHIDMCIRDNLKAGMSPDEARSDAERRFGDLDYYTDACVLMHDQHPFRVLWRSVAMIGMIGAGIGIITTIAILLNAVLFQPLSFEQPAERMARIEHRNSDETVSLPDFLDWRNQTQVAEAMSIFRPGESILTGTVGAEWVRTMRIGRDFFKVYSGDPLIGRTFRADETEFDAKPVVILSEALWTRRFKRDSTLVGRSILLDGDSVRVIGVMPHRAQLAHRVDLWTPFAIEDWMLQRSHRPFYAIVRLKPDMSLEDAQQDFDSVARQLAAAYPESNSGWTIRIVPARHLYGRSVRPTLIVLFTIAGLLLFMLWANMFQEGLARIRRLRRSGTRRGYALTKALILTLIGGFAGLEPAHWGAAQIKSVFLGWGAELYNTDLSYHVVLFVLGLSLITFLFGHGIPVWFRHGLLKCRSNNPMIDYVKGAMGVGVVAITTALFMFFGFGLKRYVEMQRVDPGFSTSNQTVVRMALPGFKYRDMASYQDFSKKVIDQIEALPAVQQVSLARSFPLTNQLTSYRVFRVDTDTLAAPHFTLYNTVSSRYFDQMEIPIVAGRGFGEKDVQTGKPVAIVSQSMAKQFWPNADPIGKAIDIGGDGWVREVIGVVADVRYRGPDRDIEPITYVSDQQSWSTIMHLIIRTGETGISKATIQKEIRRVDPDISFPWITTDTSILSNQFLGRRIRLSVLGIVAGLGLLFAILFLYRTMAETVDRRRETLNIHIMPERTYRAILRRIWRVGLCITAGGVVLGWVLALGLSGRFGIFAEVQQWQSMPTIGFISLLITIMLLLTTCLPAHRILRTSVNAP